MSSLLRQRPVQCVYTASDMEAFKNSETYSSLMKFILSLATSTTTFSIPSPSSDSSSTNPAILRVKNFFVRISQLIDETPPVSQPMRFGNKAFRSWKAKVSAEIPSLLSDLLPPTLDYKDFEMELSYYLLESFGNEIRIDYGTGHELNIIIFFYCLHKLDIFNEKDFKDVVLVIFVAYISLMRRLQQEYVLEPAGSHGVWGLDDYHCLLFLFGAAQLRNHPSILPSSVLDENTLRKEAANYLYMEGIAAIRKVKSRAPFSETSPMLYDISQLPDWHRVFSGLTRLFEGEVLGKLPVVQHLYFGSILKCTWTSEQSNQNDRERRVCGDLRAEAARVTISDEFSTKAPWTK